MSKQVMMSNRGGGGGGGGGGTSGGPSIGNYKGVMLCNRPFAGVTAAAKAAGGGDGGRLAFKTGVPDSMLGLNPAKRILPKSKMKKTQSAISKHKRWLKSLQKQKRELEAEMDADETAKAERRAKFAERERRMRLEVKDARHAAGRAREEYGVVKDPMVPAAEQLAAELAAGTAAVGMMEEMQTSAANPQDELDRMIESKVAAENKLSDAQQGVMKRRNKPAWAYTEESKAAEEKEAEEEEVDDLLAFAKSLDFDQFAEDYEVRSALEQLKARIESLTPRARAEDAARAKMAMGLVLESKEFDTESVMLDAGKKVLRALTEENLEEWTKGEGARMGLGLEGKVRDDDNMSYRSILDDVKSIGNIHSEKSIKAIKKRIEAEKGVQLLDKIDEEAPIELPPYDEPKVVSTKEEDRISHKTQPSRLPYINRNPAV